MKLMTIGYEGLNIKEFIYILEISNIDLLIDVRELPISRKKGFSKGALSDLLLKHGVDYTHLRKLGCPRPIRYDYRSDQNWDKYTQRFTAYLNTQGEVIEHLNTLVSKLNCCLLCFEANPQLCHRSLIAKQLWEEGNGSIEIVHLRASQILNFAVVAAKPL